MWWVDTLSWVNQGLTENKKIKKPLLLQKLQYASEGVHFWLDENKNDDPNLLVMNPNSLNLFATYSILGNYLFRALSGSSDFSNTVYPDMSGWIDSNSHDTSDIRANILDQIEKNHD